MSELMVGSSLARLRARFDSSLARPRARFDGLVCASFLAFGSTLLGCGADPKPSLGGSGELPVDAGTSEDLDPISECPEDNPYCDDGDDGSDNECGNLPIDLTPVGVNIMVAVDGAASMKTHWQRIQSAVKALADGHPSAAVGLQVFWGELVGDLQEGLAKSNWCGGTNNNILDVGANTAQSLVKFLGAAPPGPDFVGGLWETSPVIEPLNYYLKNATKLADPTRTNYLVFITNGNDNCFGSVFAGKKTSCSPTKSSRWSSAS